MLILIDDLIGELVQKVDCVDYDVLEALENIATARYQGKHIVLGSIETLSVLKESTLLSDRARRVYNKIYSQIPQFGSITNKFVRKIQLVPNNCVEAISTNTYGKTIRLPARRFIDNATCIETILLAENQIDCNIYAQIAKVYLVQSGLGKISLTYEPRGGGGSTIANEYNVVQQQNKRLCLCLVDSDKKHPKGGLGDTAKAISRIDDPTKMLCELVVMDSRELENLISTNLYESLNEPSHRHTVKFFRHLESSQVTEARRYLDFKNGMSLYSIINKANDKTYQDFWLEVVNKLSPHFISIDLQCIDSPKCDSKFNCQCVLLNGYGEKVLELTWERIMSMQTPHKTVDQLCVHVRTEWEKIGSIISSWCCTLSPLRSV